MPRGCPHTNSRTLPSFDSERLRHSADAGAPLLGQSDAASRRREAALDIPLAGEQTGKQRVEDAVSPNVPAGNIIFSLIIMTVLYSGLTIIAVKLGLKYGTGEVSIKETISETAAAD